MLTLFISIFAVSFYDQHLELGQLEQPLGQGHNQYWFTSLADAKEIITACKVDYNENRRHSSLGNLTPEQFRQQAELKIQNQGEKLRSIGNVKLAAVS